MTYYTSKFVMFKRGEMKLVLSEGMGGSYTLVRNPLKVMEIILKEEEIVWGVVKNLDMCNSWG